MMEQSQRVVAGAFLMLAAASTLNADEFRYRWVERFADTDHVIGGEAPTVNASSRRPRHLRIQFGIFDSESGPADEGGFLSWTIGRIETSGGINTRTPGRVIPYVFSSFPSANGVPPLPEGDPFTILTDIDASLRDQTPFWECNAEGKPNPQPEFVVRARNSFDPVYEITTDSSSDTGPYTITVSGELRSAVKWDIFGTPFPPDCGDPEDPKDDKPGSIVFNPVTSRPMPFSLTLTINVGLCPADFNTDESITSQDFFDFLGAFFNESPDADFNGDMVISSQDFFDFMDLFLQGC